MTDVIDKGVKPIRLVTVVRLKPDSTADQRLKAGTTWATQEPTQDVASGVTAPLDQWPRAVPGA